MNKPVGALTPESEIDTEASRLSGMRAPFPPHQISKLPKGGTFLDYVGHAALTDRLLDVDPLWSWEPMSLTPAGLPNFDPINGLWIKLTVCGVTRLGYGSAGNTKGGDAVKEIIGDALRNAGMRFGAALDLWHKGDLHAEDEDPVATAEEMAMNLLRGCGNKVLFADAWNKNKEPWKKLLDRPAYERVVAEMKRLAVLFPKDEPKPADTFDADAFNDTIPF